MNCSILEVHEGYSPYLLSKLSGSYSHSGFRYGFTHIARSFFLIFATLSRVWVRVNFGCLGNGADVHIIY